MLCIYFFSLINFVTTDHDAIQAQKRISTWHRHCTRLKQYPGRSSGKRTGILAYVLSV